MLRVSWQEKFFILEAILATQYSFSLTRMTDGDLLAAHGQDCQSGGV
jgi:hypothetical protein